MKIDEDQINTSKLVDIFNNAFVEILEVKESEIIIQGQNCHITIRIDSDRKYIRFFILQFLENASIQDVSNISNTLNSKVVLARFFALEHEGRAFIGSDYTHSYERGLIAYHLIKTVRFFEKITVECIQENFSENLR